MTFLEELATKGVIRANQIEGITRRAREKHSGDLDVAIIESGVDEKDLLKFKSEYFNIPFKTIETKTVSFDVLKYIPEDSAGHYQFVPLSLREGILEVGVLNPGNIQAMDALQFISAKLNIPFKIFLITKSDFDVILNNYKGLTGEVDQALSERASC